MKLSSQLAMLIFREEQLLRPNYEFENLCEKFDLEIKPIQAKAKSLLNRDSEGNYKFAHKSIYEYFVAKVAFDNLTFRKGLIFLNVI